MLKTGLTHTSTVQVGTANTARTMGSGDLDVFATPAMVALMENAAALAAAQGLPEGSTTVGAVVSISHLKPTAVGGKVMAKAELTAIDGRKLTFRVEASDGEGVIGEGEHVRYVVDRGKFMAKLTEDK